jgi:hypothetical protein
MNLRRAVTNAVRMRPAVWSDAIVRDVDAVVAKAVKMARAEGGEAAHAKGEHHDRQTHRDQEHE